MSVLILTHLSGAFAHPTSAGQGAVAAMTPASLTESFGQSQSNAGTTQRIKGNAGMAKSHHDKVAVISGGANGIGQAFAQRLAQDGAHVVIADVAPGNETAKLVEAAGRQALACTCDVSSEDSV